ncbi:MAG: hypothetical protein V4439_01895 [Patescibacteria group bacterium]
MIENYKNVIIAPSFEHLSALQKEEDFKKINKNRLIKIEENLVAVEMIMIEIEEDISDQEHKIKNLKFITKDNDESSKIKLRSAKSVLRNFKNELAKSISLRNDLLNSIDEIKLQNDIASLNLEEVEKQIKTFKENLLNISKGSQN